MNIGQALRAPWLATPRPMGRLAAGVIALGVLSTPLDYIFGTPAPWQLVLVILSLTALVPWVFVIPNMLALSLAARNLRLPGIRGNVVLSLCVYAVLTTLVPTLGIGLAGGPALTTGLILALAAEAGLLYAIMPGYIAIGFVVAMITAPLWTQVLGWPLPGGPGFVPLASTAVVLLMLAVCLRWTQFERMTSRHSHGFRRATVVGLNSHVRGLLDHQFAAGSSANLAQRLQRQRPDGLQREVDISDTGPRFVARSLRIALGGGYLPQTLKSRLWQLIPALWPFAALVLIFLLEWHLAGMDLAHALAAGGLSVIALLFIPLIVVIATLSTTAQVARLWRQTNTQLPMLALLPHIGSSTDIRRTLLRTMLMMPFPILVVDYIVLAALVIFAHIPPSTMIPMLIMPAAWACLLVTQLLSTLGGMHGAATRNSRLFMYAIAILLSAASAWLPIMTFINPASDLIAIGSDLLPLGWLIFIVALVVVGRRGWQHFLARPHVFMANAR